MATRRGGHRRWMGLALILLAAAGCGPAVPAVTGPTLAPGEVSISIESGTQAAVGQLRIGAGNFREEEYSTEDGQTKVGLTAGLWFSTSEAPEDPPMVRVHPGQVVKVRGLQVRVIDVLPNVVHVAVTPSP